MIAPPSDIPELTKPNTLPIWPGGAASLTITSRGVRLAPVIIPATKRTPIVGNSASEMTPVSNSSAAAPIVNTTTKGRWRSVRSATQPPTSTPPIMPNIAGQGRGGGCDVEPMHLVENRDQPGLDPRPGH